MNKSYEILAVLVVYTAGILLIYNYVYPFLKKTFRRKISISIRIHTEKKEDTTKEKQVVNPEGTPSILGKSKFVLCQPLPHAATDFETKNCTEKENTFAPETTKKEDGAIDYETGEGLDLGDDEKGELAGDPPVTFIDGDDESGEETDPLSEPASGVDFNELGITAKAVQEPDASSVAEKKLAGKVLCENQYTRLVESIRDIRPDYAKRISFLIEMHEREYAESQNCHVEAGRKKRKLHESEEFQKFDINDIS